MTSKRRAFIAGARMQGLIVLLAVGMVMTAVGIVAALGDGSVGPHGARVYVDAYHSARHSPRGENLRHHHAYHTVSGTRRWVAEVQRAGLAVHVESERGFDAATLAGFDVVVLGEQSHEAKFMSADERRALLSWVEDGGGLLAFGPPPDPEFGTAAFDQLFADLGVRAHRTPPAPAPGTGPSVVRRPSHAAEGDRHPVMAGVDEHLVRAGTGIETEHAIAFAGLEAGDAPDGVGASLPATVAALEHGRGRVVILADVDAVTNPMLHFGDHARLVENTLAWLAPPGRDPMTAWALAGALVLALGGIGLRRGRVDRRASAAVLAGGVFAAGAWLWGQGTDARSYGIADVFVHTGNGSTMDLSSEAGSGYFSLYTHWGKDPAIRAWASAGPIEPGHDALVLAAPTVAYTPEQLAVIGGYARSGGTVVYLASATSLRSEAGQQLRDAFEVEVEFGEPVLRDRAPYLAHGPDDLLDGVFRVYVSPRARPVRSGRGLTPLVHLSPGGWHVDDRMWTRRNCVYDLVSESRTGAGGTFMLVAPVELFDNRSLGGAYKVGDEVVQQTIDLSIRLLQRAAGRAPFASAI